MSIDEQSSIDCSQLIDPSQHTALTMASATAKAQFGPSHPPGHKTSAADVLAALAEEHSHDEVTIQQNPSDPLFEELRQEKPQQEEPSIHPTTMSIATNASTAGPSFTHAPSRTMHTSNVDAKAYRKMEEESERFAAWAIHIVLGVFCGLVILAVVMTFFIVQNYGLVAMMGVSLVLCFMVFLAYFVDQTILSQDTKLRPIRQKIIHVVEVAKKAVVEEFNLFKRDWNEHFLLTNGSMEDEEKANAKSAPRAGQPAMKKKRSVVFRAIKSSFRLGRKVFRGQKRGSTGQEPKYHPPNAENGVIA